jgi:septum formation protein
VIRSDGEELGEGPVPSVLAEVNALSKVRAAAVPTDTVTGAFVLGADTVVVAEGRILGKPATEDEAADMLRRLSGRSHEVVTGVCLARWDGSEGRICARGSAVTLVRFRPLEVEDIRAYLDSGEWRGKAGAYAIQGRAALFVQGIEGDYANVVGLPLELLGRLFRQAGFDLLRRRWRQTMPGTARGDTGSADTRYNQSTE